MAAKPGIMLLIGKHMAKHGDDKPDHEKDLGKSDDMEKSAVSDLIDAIKSGDVDAAHEALKDAIHLMMSDDEDESEDESEPDGDEEEQE